MEVKQAEIKLQQSGDETIQLMLRDILAGLRTKMVQPVLEQNLSIVRRLEELRTQDQAGVAELRERLEALEQKVQQVPVIILSALRDAINQAGGGSQDVG